MICIINKNPQIVVQKKKVDSQRKEAFMAKKRLILGVALIMCLSLFAGCNEGIKEKSVNNMIELHTWYFTSGIPNNAIKVKHSDNDVDFICAVDKGRLWSYDTHEFRKNVAVKTSSTIYWDYFDMDEESEVSEAYLEIVLKKDDTIIGYAVIKIERIEKSFDYSAKVLKSVLFPKVSGQYQEVSEEYVKATIEKIKADKGDQ